MCLIHQDQGWIRGWDARKCKRRDEEGTRTKGQALVLKLFCIHNGGVDFQGVEPIPGGRGRMPMGENHIFQYSGTSHFCSIKEHWWFRVMWVDKSVWILKKICGTKEMPLGYRDDSLGKGACSQDRPPEFDPHSPHSGRTEPTDSCKLSSGLRTQSIAHLFPTTQK